MAKQPESNQPRPISAPIDSTAIDAFPQKIVVRVPDLDPDRTAIRALCRIPTQ